jgi:hypothetical protein
MKIRKATFAAIALATGAAALVVACAKAPAPASNATAPAAAGGAASGGTAAGGAARAASQVEGNLRQVMRGILFPNSNVVFLSQGTDPATVPQDTDPTAAVNPLASSYGGWEAVENSSIALAEAANLLTIPGRNCANGKPVPIQNADWQRFVQQLRDAGMTAYKAAQSKDMDKMLDASDALTTACSDCHDAYREKTPERGGEDARCTTQ